MFGMVSNLSQAFLQAKSVFGALKTTIRQRLATTPNEVSGPFPNGVAPL